MKRKILFPLITFSIPIVFFLLLELVLRLFGVGDSYDLFIPAGDRWQVNTGAAAKYFTQKNIAIPELIARDFPRQKQDNTFRILCLGGSTTAGFPYEVNINFPYFIKTRLDYLYTDKNIEVINLGISAINSFTVLDLAPQMKIVEPDLILIYIGHNEFYGALGVASAEFTSLNRSIIKFILALRQVRIYQVLSELYYALLPEPEGPRGDLMQKMIAEHLIDRDSEAYTGTIRNFRENLREMFQIFQEDSIPVIIGTVVSNLADQPPLQDLAASGGTAAAKPSPAMEKYNEGRQYYEAADFKKAKVALTEARDLDGMRFRASSDINKIIKETAGEVSLPIAEIEALFVRYSKNGIPGQDIFLEHLHPKPQGYGLIARGFVEAIAEAELLPKSRMLPQPDLAYLSASDFTLLDQVIGDLKILKLVNEYPFNGRSGFKPVAVPDKKISELAGQHVQDLIFWDKAHYLLGDYYLEQNQPYKALAEYRAVSIADTSLPTPYYKVAKVATVVENYYQAERNYKKAIKKYPDGHFLYAKLGIILIARKKFEEARDILEILMEKEKAKPTLSAFEMTGAKYLLGVAYAQNKQLPEAEKMLRTVLAENKDHAKALDLLRQIEAYKGD